MPAPGAQAAGRNFHPTVKPVALMRWLVRLVCSLNTARIRAVWRELHPSEEPCSR